MHDLEPYYHWRDYYVAEEDEHSPFYKREHAEFHFTHKIYNHYIHPQWDEMGSNTLFCKVIYANYEKNFAAIELIGEWNDLLYNDIMEFKTEVINPMIEKGIYKFVLLGEYVFNFHPSDDSYYEAWWEDIKEENGYVLGLNFRKHIVEEMRQLGLGNFLILSEQYEEIQWRKVNPHYFHKLAEEIVIKELGI